MHRSIENSGTYIAVRDDGWVCRQDDSPSVDASWVVSSTTVVPYTHGLDACERPTTPGENSGLLTLLIVTFMLVAFSFRHCVRLFGTFTQDLWSTRRRENAFNEHTSNESRTLIVLIFQTCVYEALALFTHVCHGVAVPDGRVFAVIGSLTVLVIVYYLLQLLAYAVVGNVFSDRIGAAQWIKGYNAAHSLLGFFIMAPALASLFYPSLASEMFAVVAGLYLVARVIFICKGFRIFYHNFGSLLYFILYLCTLEMIPVIWVYSGARLLVDFLL